jgi:hypothetical protein
MFFLHLGKVLYIRTEKGTLKRKLIDTLGLDETYSQDSSVEVETSMSKLLLKLSTFCH